MEICLNPDFQHLKTKSMKPVHSFRKDLSRFVIHTVRRRDPVTRDDPYEPIGFSSNWEPILPPGIVLEQFTSDYVAATSHTVLQEVLLSGYVRATWAFRKKDRATIYGPFPAVCITEMPLYALLNQGSSDKATLESFGIALLKSEIFAAGARQVIYGLTTRPSIEDFPVGEHPSVRCFRRMSENALALREQYRYIPTDLEAKLDWTDLREWRWPLVTSASNPPSFPMKDGFGKTCYHKPPGLPVWLEGCERQFGSILLFVKTATEASELFQLMQRLYDGEPTNCYFFLSKQALMNTWVFSVDELIAAGFEYRDLRLEEIPKHRLKRLVPKSATPGAVSRVRAAVEEARTVARETLSQLKCDPGGCGDVGDMGTVVTSSFSDATQALLECGEAIAYGGIEYFVYGVGRGIDEDIAGIRCIHQEAASRAATILSERLGQPFSVRVRLDG